MAQLNPITHVQCVFKVFCKTVFHFLFSILTVTDILMQHCIDTGNWHTTRGKNQFSLKLLHIGMVFHLFNTIAFEHWGWLCL